LPTLGLAVGLIPATTANAQVTCIPSFSYTSGPHLYEKTNCGADTKLVSANVGGTPTLSPDEQFVAVWHSYYQGHVSVKAADGSTTVDLGIGGSPAWSPDSFWLALPTGVNDTTRTLDVVGRDGSGRRSILTQNTGADYNPAWSPDGTKIATIHRDDASGLESLYVQDSTGANRRLLAEAPRADAPAWTPDGNYLVFTQWPWAGAESLTGLYVVALSGGNAVKLSTISTGQPRAPTIARDWSLGYMTNNFPFNLLFVVQTINDPTGAFQYSYDDINSAEFRPQGTVTAPPPNWPPAGVGAPCRPFIGSVR
jgi:Tol biopolymer transport system component